MSENARIDELLDEAIDALNTGDVGAAHSLAELVLREDARNQEAGELLAVEGAASGELRRLTILCCDLVGSTELSERQDPERYRSIVQQYRVAARRIIRADYEGHIVSAKGDGFLALFGYPTAHEDDTLRAVRAGLDVCAAVREISGLAHRVMGESLDVRVGIHRGLVFVDTDEDDVYGLAANLASRVEGIAAPGTVVITDSVRRLVAGEFEVTEGAAQPVKGVSELVLPFTVRSERARRPDAGDGVLLVGREAELAALRSAWDRVSNATTGGPVSVLVRGEPGIGKSRLAAALVAEIRAQGGTVLELAGSPFHTSAGFHPVRVLLESRCGIDTAMDPPERLERLHAAVGADGVDPATVVPWLAPVLGLTAAAGYEPVAAEGRKLDEEITAVVRDYLTRCFGSAPGVLLVEDLQWHDESTLAALRAVLADGPANVLVLATTREAPRFPVHTVLEPQPLSIDDRLRLVEALDDVGMDHVTRHELAARSDGVPLYLEELVRGWSPESTAADGAQTPAVPDPLYEPLVARLTSTRARIEVAGAAATVGRELDHGLLTAVLDLDEEDLDRELEALVEGTILVPTGSRSATYRFRHELLREVAYEMQPPAVRRRVHERLADLLVVGADAPELVDWNMAATHYERGGRLADAAAAHAQAADQARRRGALGEAREQLGLALELTAQAAPGPDRMAAEVAYRLRRGFLAMSTEGAASAVAASDYARCLELALADAESDEMFSSLISLWAYHLSRAELARAGEVLEVLRSRLDGDRAWFRPANRAGFGMLAWFEGRYEPALQILEDARVQLDRSWNDALVNAVWFVPNDPTTSIFVHLALARFTCGDTAGADVAMSTAEAIAATLEFPQGAWSNAYASWLRSWMLTERGELDTAVAVAGELLDHAGRHGFDSWAMIAATQLSAIETTRALSSGEGDLAALAGGLAGMVALWEAVGLTVFLPYYLTLTGAALARAGDRHGATAQLDRADAMAAATGMRFYAAETTRWRGHTTGAPADHLRAAVELAVSQGTPWFALRAALDLHEFGEPDALPMVHAALGALAPDAAGTDLMRARAALAGA